ncbi:MAG TPA: hypothetical protein VMB02_01350 [Candidatus Aquilonibacter sp.]|nr:hypothetical protein [Candidatus Aquilonibacter sp.]
MAESRGSHALTAEFGIRRAKIERDILRGICRTKLPRGIWAKIAEQVGEYAWQEAEHGAVYAAIRRLSALGNDPKTLREQLPAQLTRMGFPDVDWTLYLVPRGKAPTGANAILRKIRKAIQVARNESPRIDRSASTKTQRPNA